MSEQKQKEYYVCRNVKCNKPGRTHRNGTVCDYDVTAKCSTCGKDLYERDREYAVFKFGTSVCAAHSGNTFWEGTV